MKSSRATSDEKSGTKIKRSSLNIWSVANHLPGDRGRPQGQIAVWRSFPRGELT